MLLKQMIIIDRANGEKYIAALQICCDEHNAAAMVEFFLILHLKEWSMKLP